MADGLCVHLQANRFPTTLSTPRAQRKCKGITGHANPEGNGPLPNREKSSRNTMNNDANSPRGMTRSSTMRGDGGAARGSPIHGSINHGSTRYLLHWARHSLPVALSGCPQVPLMCAGAKSSRTESIHQWTLNQIASENLTKLESAW